MITIEKKIVIDERGQPKEVIISWAQYQKISEMLGLDLGEKAIADLRQAQRDRAANKMGTYVELDAIR
jgi:PHD/YefM family antitoxin component YafN of YafNO toxin-antitoxin module